MKKEMWYTYLCCILSAVVWSQQNQKDSIQELEEIIVITKDKTDVAPSTSIENYLKQGKGVDMIHRGNYAWEPTLNSMATERISITIDGMHIFNACTDKMDPITSYVETTNLQQASILSGQQGTQYGPTLGGSINLQTQRSYFTTTPQWKGTFNLGYEANNNLKTGGTVVQYASSKWYAQAQATGRKASNYKAGNNEEVPFSQYTKTNLSGTLGYALGDSQTLEAQVIYDKATDVGYPALPMDVSLAEAMITSVSYIIKPVATPIDSWETKLYFNTITHRMDDTKRPAETIAIHMDMPGWSDTYGLYSMLTATQKNHHLTGTLNAYYNKSLAEMTMYPNNPNEKEMFMYTWPDVHTQYTGINLQDHWAIDDTHSLLVSASLGTHTNQVKNQEGMESLQIFYPAMTDSKTRLLSNLAINYQIKKFSWNYGAGVAVGNRAPSVSEGYGFYLFNSSDQFDYIGNPNLKNEFSTEVNAFLNYTVMGFSSRLSGSVFHIKNYIIGELFPEITPMTIGAKGIKQYNNLSYAQLVTIDWLGTYKFNSQWLAKAKVSYHYGKTNEKDNLPFISPLSYGGSVTYSPTNFQTTLEVQANAAKNNNSIIYGEQTTASYALLHWTANYTWDWNTNSFTLYGGVNNLLDTYYSTYSDWNTIPRMGRNIFVSLQYTW